MITLSAMGLVIGVAIGMIIMYAIGYMHGRSNK
jgi:membrane protein DedA with SNARE-associated domain